MKKTIPQPSLALIGAACAILTLSSWKSNTMRITNRATFRSKKLSGVLPNEDALNVTGDTLQPPTVNKGFNLKNSSLYVPNSTGSNVTIDSLADNIDTLYMRNLYNIAVNEKTGTHYITALQVQRGLFNHKVKLFYKPLCLTRDSTHVSGSTTYGYYSNHNSFSNVYYTYTPGTGFVSVTYSTFQTDSTDYMDSIRIRHYYNLSTIGNFYTALNDSGDVHSEIFPFQEIYSLIKNNPNSRYVKSCNVAAKLNELLPGGTYKYFTKHCLVFGPSDLPPAKTANVSGSGTYYNVYADLGGMCPPGCGELYWPLQ